MELTNSYKQEKTLVDVDDFMSQYPWLVEVVQTHQNKNKIHAYLDVKSGSWRFMDLGEF